MVVHSFSQGASLSVNSRPIIVFVDDEAAILRSYARLLRNEPYDVMTFHDPVRALAWIERSGANLVFSDERMPEMRGTDFLVEVSRRSPQTKCAIITAFPDTQVVTRESCARIERLIAKPWDGQHLKGVIRTLLGHRGGRIPDRWLRDDLLQSSPGQGQPFQIRIDLAGRKRAHVLDQVIPLSIWSHQSQERPVVVLENLDRFVDSVEALCEDLIRVVERLDARLTVRDDTGALAALLAARRRATNCVGDSHGKEKGR